MPDVLIYADTFRSPELRHEVPVAIGDPFLYVERGGERFIAVSSLEIPRLEGLDGLRLIPLDELGADELASRGLSVDEIASELVLRACNRIGVTDAVAPATFPLAVADRIRASGVGITPDPTFFAARRRAKTRAELAGIRRAQRAAERAMDAIRDALRSQPGVTSEELQARAATSFTAHGVGSLDLPIASHGPQTAIGHEVGRGPVLKGEPVVVDLFPQDIASGCFADMTRTFCVGEPPAELADWHRLCREALELAVEHVAPGVLGRDLHRIVCERFQAAGHLTQLTKTPGKVLDEGFYHSLGHGVGLDVHEGPYLGRAGDEPLVPGDVLAVEPGLYRPGFGGCRLEDLVLVTEDGCEMLTDYDYDLAP